MCIRDRSYTTSTTFSTTFEVSNDTEFNTTAATSRSTTETRNTSESRNTTTVYNTSTTKADFTSANTSTFTVFNTITTFNTTAAVQTRYRSYQQFFAMLSCTSAVLFTVYRVVGTGNSSGQVIQIGDYLYTNSGGTNPLASGNYGLSSNSFGSPSHQITVGGSGYVTGVLACQGGGDGPGCGDGPQR